MPEAKPQGLLEETMELTEALSNSGDGIEPGGYASSSDEEDRQDCEAVQGLQEEVCRLHEQVWGHVTPACCAVHVITAHLCSNS